MRLLSWSSLLLWAGMLLGCFPRGDPSRPIPTALVEAPQQARRLVVVLPGRGDDLDGLRRSGIAPAIQSAWPDADVMLAGLALGYYMEGQAELRLHEEVVVPAKRKGYSQIWLVGASLGGMGAIMYDRSFPGSVTGLVLLAPYLGDAQIQNRIRAAGGVAAWRPSPKPDAVDADNFQEELWRHVQGWSLQPAAARNVWLAYGNKDRFAPSMPLLSVVLEPAHTLVRDGGHDWELWSPLTREVLLQIGASSG